MAIVDLLIDCIRRPSALLKERTSDTNPSRVRSRLLEVGALQDNYPNFEAMGFTSQAFVDIELSSDADSEAIVSRLHNIPGVIMIYTVFGQIDIRCKAVGMTLKQVENVAIQIRPITGVSRVYTTVIVDEAVNADMRENWALLIESNSERLDL